MFVLQAWLLQVLHMRHALYVCILVPKTLQQMPSARQGDYELIGIGINPSSRRLLV